MVHGMRNTDELLKSRKQNNLWECLVLLLTGFYILFLSVYNTTYNFPTIPQFYAVLYCMSTVVLLRTIATRQWNREVLLSLCLGVIYYLAYRTGAEHFLLFLAVISLGTVRMNYKSVLKIYVAVVSVFCLLWVTSSFGGLLSNLVYYRSGHLRSSWGMAYPTDFASTLLFLLMIGYLVYLNVFRVSELNASVYNTANSIEPSRPNSRFSFINVEKVVKPPQNPVTRTSLVDGEI